MRDANTVLDKPTRSTAPALWCLLLLAAGLLLGLAAWMQFRIVFWGDQDYELLVARMWLSGKRLYLDHVPVLPPLIFYLYAIPAWLSLHSPLKDFQALVLLTWCAIAFSIFLCTRLVAQHPAFGTRGARLRLILLLSFVLVFRELPPFFADREHLMMVLGLPYLLRWMPTLCNTRPSLRLRLTIGFMAGVGFCIKPHGLLLLAAVQLVGVAHMHSLRMLASAENLAVYGFGLCYALVVCHYTPEYLTLVLPMAWYTYSAMRGSPGGMGELSVSLALTFLPMLCPARAALRKDIYYLAALLPFFYFYTCINNGWAYTYQPLMTMLLIICGFLLFEALDALPGWKPALAAALCLLNFAMETALTLNYFYDASRVTCRGDEACPGYYAPFVREIHDAGAHSFGTLGMDFTLWTRVSKLSGASWDTRFFQLWMMPKFYIADDAFFTAHQDILHYAADALAEDLDTRKPELVFVEISRTLYTLRLGRPVDWVDDLSNVAAFRHAWQHYTLTRTIDDCSELQPVDAALAPHEVWVKPDENNCRYAVYRRLP